MRLKQSLLIVLLSTFLLATFVAWAGTTASEPRLVPAVPGKGTPQPVPLKAVLSTDVTPADLVASLSIASGTSTFTLDLPAAGCVSFLSPVKGRKEVDRLWGPEWLEAGRHRISFHTSRLAGRSGSVEVFSLKVTPEKAIGRAGKGERQFIHPMGMSWDAVNKELYVADTGNDRIVRMSVDGRFIGQYGGFGVAFGDRSEEREDSLDEPYDVAAGGFSNLFVSDQNNNRLCEFDTYRAFKGTLFPRKGETRERLNRPRGCVIDTENHLWVVDAMQDRVLKISATGDIMLRIGGFGWSQQRLKEPTQVAVDGDGKVYICDRGNRRIQVFDRLGGYIREIRDHLKSPVGVAVDPDGLVWICDDETGELGIYTPSGRRLLVFTDDGQGKPFRSPSDLAALALQAILLDSGNHRLVLFSRSRQARRVSWQGPGPMVK